MLVEPLEAASTVFPLVVVPADEANSDPEGDAEAPDADTPDVDPPEELPADSGAGDAQQPAMARAATAPERAGPRLLDARDACDDRETVSIIPIHKVSPDRDTVHQRPPIREIDL